MVIRIIYKRKSNIYDYRNGDMAAFYGYIEILKFNKWLSFTTDAMDMASRTGYLETVKWLHENRTEGCTQDAMDGASHFGYIEIIKWLHENRTEGCTSWAMDRASLEGHFEIINRRWTMLPNMDI
jgi:hypothetical protein